MSKFLLLLGPSGVGKSSIIEELIRLDNRFVYISPFMTRSLREGERNKISISGEEMDEMSEQEKFLVINELYGVRYATPRQPIEQALKEGNFPVLDWPIGRVSVMTEAFPNQLYIVYITPPSIEALRQRLARDDRDADGHRLRSAHKELEALESSRHSGIYDFEIVSEENQVPKIAQMIYANYPQQFFPQKP